MCAGPGEESDRQTRKVEMNTKSNRSPRRLVFTSSAIVAMRMSKDFAIELQRHCSSLKIEVIDDSIGSGCSYVNVIRTERHSFPDGEILVESDFPNPSMLGKVSPIPCSFRIVLFQRRIVVREV